jgi:hypothetical protein
VPSRATRRLALFGLASFLILGGTGAALALRDAPSAKAREALLSHTHGFVADGESVTVQPAQLRPLLRVDNDRLTIDSVRFERLLALTFEARPAREAALQIRGNRVVVEPGSAARVLDAQATAAALLREPEARIHRVQFRWTAPDVPTAGLEALRIRGLVSQFTTHYAVGAPRVVNIRRAAELLEGRILRGGRDVLHEPGALCTNASSATSASPLATTRRTESSTWACRSSNSADARVVGCRASVP